MADYAFGSNPPYLLQINNHFVEALVEGSTGAGLVTP
jgi:hypothetical protein